MGGAPMDTTQPAAGAIDTAGIDSSAISDTTDTSGVQNPPGYRGMERDTTMVPPKRGGADSVPSGTSGSDQNDADRSGVGGYNYAVALAAPSVILNEVKGAMPAWSPSLRSG